MPFENTKSILSAAKSAVSQRVEAGSEQVEQSGLGRALSGIRSLAKSGTYARLHDELAQIVSQVKVTTSALDGRTIASLEDTYNERYRAALEKGSEEEQALASDQLDTLISIKMLLEGQGESLAERVLDRETLTNEEAKETLNYLRQITAQTEKLEKDIKVSTAGALDAFMDSIDDERLSGTYRAEVAKSVADALSSSALFKGGEAASELAEIAASVSDLSKDDSGRVADALEKMRQKLDTAEVIHDLATSAGVGDMSQAELTETLDNLLKTMRRIDGFTEEQTRLSALMREDIHGDQSREDELRSILSRLADRTVESKTLFTLNQLNDKFDAAVLDNEQLEEALEKGNLGKEFLENAGKISSGGMAGDIMGDLSNLALLSLGGEFGPMAVMIKEMLPDIDLGEALGAAGGFLGWRAFRRSKTGGAPTPAAGADKAAAAAKPKSWAGRLVQSAGRAVARHPLIAGAVALGGGYYLLSGDGDKAPVVVSEDRLTDMLGTEGLADMGSTSDLGLLTTAGLVGTATAATVAAARRKPPQVGATEPPKEEKPKPRMRVMPGGKVDIPESTERKRKPTVAARVELPPGAQKAVRASQMAGRALGPLVALGLGIKEYMEAETGEERASSIGATAFGTAGAFAGGAAGAKLGALVGTAVFPGVGTVVGSLIGTAAGIGGAVIGGVSGDMIGRYVAGMFTDAADAIPDEVKDNILNETAYINALLASPDLADEDREALEARKKELAGQVGAFIAKAESVYESMGIPQSKYMDALQADLAVNPNLHALAPSLYGEILSAAGAKWSGGKAANVAKAARGAGGRRARRARTQVASTPATVEAMTAATTVPAAPTGAGGRRARRMAARAAATADAALPVEAAPMEMYVSEPNMNVAPATPIEDDVDRIMALASTSTMQGAQPAAQSRAKKQKKTGRAGRTPKRPGAVAPSVAGDDFSITMVNSLIWA